jgi:selenide,water dikinase
LALRPQDQEDGALYAINGQTLVVTIDFGTPVSGDAYVWGKASSLNALSDVYAMGGLPLFALSVVGWPARGGDGLLDLMNGAADALQSEQTVLLGGHTITSDIPIFGLAVVGNVRENELLLLRNARPGQAIFVTKPLGTGVITAAQKMAVAPSDAIVASEQVMLTSNRLASRLAIESGIRAGTDISGYGLIGHLQNILLASRCSATLAFESVPILPQAAALVGAEGVVPNSAERTFMSLEDVVDWTNAPLAARVLLADPQTSGGLLLCAGPNEAAEFQRRCADKGQFSKQIGWIEGGDPGVIRVRPGTHPFAA